MDLTPVFICAIVFGAIYKLIELFVRRKERLKLIDKITELPPEYLADRFATLQSINALPVDDDSRSSRFTTLRWGCLLGGLGLGMVIGGFFVFCIPDIAWSIRELVVGGFVLLSGSLGLIAAFVAEYNIRRKKN